MKRIVEIVSGVFLLIAIYLFVANPKGTVSIINSFGSNSISGIKALQGRG